MKIKHCNNKQHTDCPINYTAQLIGDTWSIMIVRDLLSGKKRFMELSNSLIGISSKTLTDRLAYLEEKGIITREFFSEIPPRVEYALTPTGMKLNNIIDDMRIFGTLYLKDINK